MNRNCVLSRTRLYQCCTLIASLFISKALLSPSWVLLTTACQPSTDAFNPHFITFPTCAFFFSMCHCGAPTFELYLLCMIQLAALFAKFGRHCVLLTFGPSPIHYLIIFYPAVDPTVMRNEKEGENLYDRNLTSFENGLGN